MKSRTLKILASIIDPSIDPEPEINASDKYFASLIRPKTFTGKDTAELRYDRSFEQNCITLSQFINKPVKDVSTREYFSLIEHYNKEARKNKK